LVIGPPALLRQPESLREALLAGEALRAEIFYFGFIPITNY